MRLGMETAREHWGALRAEGEFEMKPGKGTVR